MQKVETTRKTEIVDCFDQPHQYVLTIWDYKKTMAMQEMLFGLIIEPLVGILMAANANSGEDEGKIEAVESSLSAVLATLPQKLAALGLGSTCKDILMGVSRVDEDKQGNEVPITLNDNDMTYGCYTGGNMAEMYQAVYWVMKENLFPLGIQTLLSSFMKLKLPENM